MVSVDAGSAALGEHLLIGGDAARMPPPSYRLVVANLVWQPVWGVMEEGVRRGLITQSDTYAPLTLSREIPRDMQIRISSVVARLHAHSGRSEE